MAKFVIAASCNCPYYSKVELLADELAGNLPHFKIHKIVKAEEEWGEWLRGTCEKNGWEHSKSPIVWRELVDRGGKGLLIGGYNEFMEYAQCYYGVTSQVMTELMLKMSEENKVTCYEKIKEQKYYESLSEPIHICITNASSSVSYHLIAAVASGRIFGKDVEISLKLLDREENMETLRGVELETYDLAYPLLRKVELTSDLNTAFKEASAVFILDELPMENGQVDSREEWLKRNAELFECYAEALNNHAQEDIKVLVAGEGPVNFNTHVLVEKATKITKQNIVAASRLQERRARAIIADKLNVNAAGIKDAIVWGDCSYDGADKTYIDINAARCHGYDGAVWGPQWFSRPVTEMVHDNKWLSTDFIANHKSRGTLLTDALRHHPSVSAATAVATHMKDWVQGTKENDMYSLGVECEGWYGIKSCVFSLPVRFTEGSYQVVWDLTLDDEMKSKLSEIERQLKKDIYTVYPSEDELFTEEKKFDENSDLISAMIQAPAASPVKAASGEKLEKIEEESEDQPSVAKEQSGVADDTQPTVTPEDQSAEKGEEDAKETPVEEETEETDEIKKEETEEGTTGKEDDTTEREV